MWTKYFIDILTSLILMIVLVARRASTQCTTNGCTVCTDIELICEGLNNVPPLDTLDALSTDEQTISFTNGAINEIPEGYFNLSTVVSIDLSNNRLTTLNMHSFEFARDLQTIVLTGNPIVCDSNIDWLQKWKRFYPANTVNGSCAGSGENIEAYLSDKPRNLVDVRFDAASLVFDRLCDVITIPFTVVGKFTSDLEYRAYIDGTSSNADISVTSEYITVPVGTNTTEITIDITNRGENRDNIQTFLKIIPKYPVSFESNAVIKLQNGAPGCEAPVPVITKTTTAPPTPAASENVTSKPGGSTPPDGSMSMAPKASTEPGPTTEPTPTKKGSAASQTPSVSQDASGRVTSKPRGDTFSPDVSITMTPKVSTTAPDPSPTKKQGCAAWVIVPIVIILVIIIVVLVIVYKKYNTPNKTVGNDKPVAYAAVQGGDGKVYSATTEDVA